MIYGAVLTTAPIQPSNGSSPSPIPLMSRTHIPCDVILGVSGTIIIFSGGLMYWFFILVTIITGLLGHTLGRWGLIISMFTTGLKVAAVVMVLAAAVFTFRWYRYRK